MASVEGVALGQVLGGALRHCTPASLGKSCHLVSLGLPRSSRLQLGNYQTAAYEC